MTPEEGCGIMPGMNDAKEEFSVPERIPSGANVAGRWNLRRRGFRNLFRKETVIWFPDIRFPDREKRKVGPPHRYFLVRTLPWEERVLEMTLKLRNLVRERWGFSPDAVKRLYLVRDADSGRFRRTWNVVDDWGFGWGASVTRLCREEAVFGSLWADLQSLGMGRTWSLLDSESRIRRSGCADPENGPLGETFMELEMWMESVGR